MDVQKFNVKNIPTFLAKTDKFKTLTIQVVFLNEFNKENATKLSLLTRLLNSSTKLYNSKKKLVNKLYDLYDASIAVYSYPTYKTSTTIFSLEIVNENNLNDKNLLNEGIEFLNEVIFNPNIENNKFSKKEFLEEKRRLKESIEKIYDNKNRYSLRKMIQLMCKDEITSVSSLGTLEDLEKITEEDIADEYQRLVNTSNISMYIVGDIEKNDVINKFSKLEFTKNSEFNFEIESNEEHNVIGIKEEKEIQNLNQSILCMGFRTEFNTSHPLYYQSLVFCEMYGGGYVSDLFRVVREENSLAYNIVSQLISDVKLMVVNAGIDGKNYDLTTNLIIKELANYKMGKINSDLLEIAKSSLISEVAEIEDDSKAYISYMIKNYMTKTDMSLEDIIYKLNETTIDDVRKVANGITLDTIFLLTNN